MFYYKHIIEMHPLALKSYTFITLLQIYFKLQRTTEHHSKQILS